MVVEITSVYLETEKERFVLLSEKNCACKARRTLWRHSVCLSVCLRIGKAFKLRKRIEF